MTFPIDRNAGKKALVAVPGASDRLKLQSHLEKMGFEVTSAHDEETCASLIMRGGFDLALLVHNPDRMRTLDIIVEHPEICEDCRVIFLAEDCAIEDAVKAMEAGATDFVPFSDEFDAIGFMLASAFYAKDRCRKPAVRKEGKSSGSASAAVQVKAPPEDKHRILTCSPVMEALLEQAGNVARSRATVLIQGESGTGKELLARFIHKNSDRAAGPFVALNCAALPETLLESELFGHEKGAFSGAIARKAGKFELASNGTLLLDEVTEMALPLQAKLLRVLQEGEVDRLGGSSPVPVDVRVVATTNRDVLAAVRAGKFREDLYFRLNVIPLKLPPLRERQGDIPFLARHFLDFFSAEYGKKGLKFARGVLERMSAMKWSGNVRELRNVVERGVLLAAGNEIRLRDLLGDEQGRQAETAPEKGKNFLDDEMFNLSDIEKEMVQKALDKTGGNRTHAARLLGISVRTLRNKLAEYRRMGLVL